MKNIGILTLPIGSNYGGILQMLALQYFLNENGYYTTLIDLKYPESLLKRVIRKIIEKQPVLDIKDIKLKKQMDQNLHSFIKAQVPVITQPLFDRKSFVSELKQRKFDAIVVGSDQVWRMDYLFGIWESTFLKGVDKNTTKKIAYAASFGISSWEYPELKTKIAGLIKDFNAVSVREATGVLLCRNQFGVQGVEHVLDPTLLIKKEFFEKFISKTKPKKGIFTYFLDRENENVEVLDYLRNTLNMDVYSINVGKPPSYLKNIKDYKKPRVEDWLQSFYDADFVVTDSYHGTIFSILYNKPFFTIANKKRGMTRFTSLLSLLNLEDRLLDLKDLSNLKKIQLTFDFNPVNLKIEKLQRKSSKFLLSALETETE